MSFFDRQAVKFHKQLEAIRGGDPRVVVATGINPKFEGGNTKVGMLGYDQFQPMFVVKSQYSSMNLNSKNIKSKGACDIVFLISRSIV
ncbi:hypothetical protein IGI04_015753 [Brassica rapa subsp. trilocularis]|uniref:Uncharacterized protein n=1 Tax=Brassica rapa subsp. trilocularis TaxID=1813537 RepID=A0ABQ7MR02_BRACM|nr:hypothetical protein IGI04_015753 [Brassica rapa subsp. trilocularis]